MTDRPSDRAIAMAIEKMERLADVIRQHSFCPPMALAIIVNELKDAIAAAPDGAPVGDQEAAWLLLRVLQQAGPYSRELIDRTKRAMEQIPRPTSQDAADAAELIAWRELVTAAHVNRAALWPNNWPQNVAWIAHCLHNGSIPP